MTGSDVLEARYTPGLSADLTHWHLAVGRNRWLHQKVIVLNEGSGYDKQVLHFWNKLSRRQLSALRGIVERIGFRRFGRRYQHETMGVTDCASYWIIVQIDGRPKEVEAYDLPRLAEYEQQ